MDDHSMRLTLAEEKIKQHDRLHEETQAAIHELTAGVNQLIQAEIRREQDSSTFKRLFNEIEKLRNELDQHGKALQTYKDDQIEKELNAYKGVVWKIAGLVAIIISSVLAGHFGGKWLG